MSLLKNWYHHTNSDVSQNVSHLLVHLLVCACMSIFWSIFWPIFINFKYIFCIILYLLFKSHKKIFYQKQLKLFYRPSVYIYFLVNLYIWLTISSCYDSIPLTLGLIGWLSLFQGWGSLTMVFTGKFVYIYIYIYKFSIILQSFFCFRYK